MNTKNTVTNAQTDDAAEPGISCPLLATIELIGDRWTLGILRCVAYGYTRFSQFEHEMGVATNILTNRLQKLVSAGVLERVQYSERPPRYEYRLTPRGEDLIPALLLFRAWGERHGLAVDSDPMVLVHTECGHDLEPVAVCGHCQQAVTRDSVGVRIKSPSAP